MQSIKVTIIIAILGLWTARLPAQHIKRKGALGVALHMQLPDSLFNQLHLKSKEGSLVKAILPQSTAAQLNMQINDWLVSINNEAITSTPQLIQYASRLRDGDSIQIELYRNQKLVVLKGIVLPKPKEVNPAMDIVYGEFAYKSGYIRTIYKQLKNSKPLATVYFLQGISCYSLDNMAPNDPTRLAIDALVNKGYSVYMIEKSGMGDNVNTAPCPTIGFNDEVELYKAGYANLLLQKNIDTQQLFVFGHSLGGVAAPLVAQIFQPKGVIVYGTGFKPWSEYLLDAYLVQLQYYGEDLGKLRDTIEQLKPYFYDYFYGQKSIAEITTTEKGLAALEITTGYDKNTGLAIAGRTLQFHKEINDNNIAKAWGNTLSYVLAIYGESDIASNNDLDHKALIAHVNAKHPNRGELLLVPKTNHTFQEIGTMAEYIAMQAPPEEYNKYAATKFNYKLFDNISNWINDKINKTIY